MRRGVTWSDLSAEARSGAALRAVARHVGASDAAAERMAERLLPTLAAGARRLARAPGRAAALARRLRATDAAALIDAPQWDGQTAETAGGGFLDLLFGDIRDALAETVAEQVGADDAHRGGGQGDGGIDRALADRLAALIAARALGVAQIAESQDPEWAAAVDAVLGPPARATRDAASDGDGGWFDWAESGMDSLVDGLADGLVGGGPPRRMRRGGPELAALFDDGDRSADADALLDRIMQL